MIGALIWKQQQHPHLVKSYIHIHFIHIKSIVYNTSNKITQECTLSKLYTCSENIALSTIKKPQKLSKYCVFGMWITSTK